MGLYQTTKQHHIYEDSTYTFEFTVESMYEPATIAEIYENAADEWWQLNKADHTLADYIIRALENNGHIVLEWDDLTNHDSTDSVHYAKKK